MSGSNRKSYDGDVAIVGMAAHLPGAHSIELYWENLTAGLSSITRLEQDTLLASGEDPARLHASNYVPFAAALADFEMFDPAFFGFSPKEAAILDPQHRQFLEVAWHAFENAGHDPKRAPGPVGVYAGCGMGSYFYFNICSNPALVDETGMFLLRHTGNDKDFLATRVSNIFDLRGPSINIQTACSTSLVALHYALAALRSGECAMALAGGVTIELPQKRGYMFEEGEIMSPDGICRAFDANAKGTVFGSGAGAVVLRPLDDAIADGDHVWAVIKGTAINNDGAQKAGYLAPSLDGQSDAIADACRNAGVTADTIGYVECHGTGTYLGDPIEVAALSDAFRETTDATQFCRIGSVKTNIGHLDTAAGVAGVIKAALSLKHRQIPPSLNYETPNPIIEFEKTPFLVNDRLYDWAQSEGPRRAGVNSLGVGGTNAFAVLEEAPPRTPSGEAEWPFHLLMVSGRSKAALDANAKALAAHLRANPEQPLADVAFTLKEGRHAFEHRLVLVAETHEEAAGLLESRDPRRVFPHKALDGSPDVVFMFPGGGAQYATMARDLYETEPVFQDWVDQGLAVLQPQLDYDLKALWLPEEAGRAEADARLTQPSVQLPLIMIVEYALAQLWMSWGVRPSALIGHSMGENAAACVAGVLSFEDCIRLVHLRGRLFDTVPEGGMLSVPLSAEDMAPLLDDSLDMASINAPELCVASGPQADLDRLAAHLAARDIECQRIPIDIAAHSRMLEPILAQFEAFLRTLDLRAPEIPLISNRTGALLTEAEATDPAYWVGHLRNTVRFADGITTLSAEQNRVYLEVGPGKALSSLTQMHPKVPAGQVLTSLRHPEEAISDDAFFLGTIGRLWALGIEADWQAIWGDAQRHRIPLPGYAFQRAPYFIEPGKAADKPADLLPMRVESIENWGYQAAWRPRYAPCDVDAETALSNSTPQTWLFFMDDTGISDAVAARLRGAGHTVVEVRPSDAFGKRDPDHYLLAPERGRDGYDELIQDLVANGRAPSRIVHAWLLTYGEVCRPGSSFFHSNLERGFYSLLFLAQAISGADLPTPLHITTLTSEAAQTSDEALPYPEKATVLGPVQVIPRELPGISCSTLDIEIPEPVLPWLDRVLPRTEPVLSGMGGIVSQVLEEVLADPENGQAALRGDRRLALTYKPMPLLQDGSQNTQPTLEAEVSGETGEEIRGGTWLITGGFGGIGLSIAEALAEEQPVNLVLVARNPLPPRTDWEVHLEKYGAQHPVSERIGAVRRLEALGASVLAVTADVCNMEQMRKAHEQAVAAFGPVTDVIHAAGVIEDAPLLSKNQVGIEEVFTPKIHGTQVLHDLFPDGSLKTLVLFSSTSTAVAPAGQIDYVAANQYLNAYAQSRSRDRTRVVAINWGMWKDVGLAAKSVAERMAPPAQPIDTPLLDEAASDTAGNRVFLATYKTDARWLLDEHRTIQGTALVPGTGYLELAAEALQAHGETAPFEICDLFMLRPLEVPDDGRRIVRVRLTRTNEGYSFQVQSDCEIDGRSAFQLNAQARLVLRPLTRPKALDLAEITERCRRDVKTDLSGIRVPQENYLAFGPRWRVLQHIGFGTDEGLARLELPERFRSDLEEGYILHPALLDFATGWAMSLIDKYGPDNLWVPVSYRSVRVYRHLPAEVFSWVRYDRNADAGSPFANFNVILTDSDGQVCLDIKGFSIKRIEENTVFGDAQSPHSAEVEFTHTASGLTRPLSPAEIRLQHILTQGIGPKDGGETFGRALATGQSCPIVSSIALDALIEEVARSDKHGETTEQFTDRPQLDSDYVAPSTSVERTLAGLWQDLLGVESVGTEDSFFDLGGHSLIAVRLFARIKRTYQMDLPISILFEAPTIAKCAAIIEEHIGGDAEDPKQPRRNPVSRRFKHLVAMHEGEGGPKTPIFLVAGMFGNVLNLRHLAHLLGTGRPFYGLQARGLYGDETPHNSFYDAAADYIMELRTVQPHGPYLLGGFSGGGIIAYEVAQQLQDAGEDVAMLAFLDTPMPVRPYLSKRDKLIIHKQEFLKQGLPYLGRWVRDRISWEAHKILKYLRTPEPIQDTDFQNAEIEAAFNIAAAQYTLRPWDGPLTLFRPPMPRRWQVSDGKWVSPELRYIYEDNGWTPWAQALEIIEVSGDHDSMVLEPNVRVLADRMKTCVEAAERALLQAPEASDTDWPLVTTAAE